MAEEAGAIDVVLVRAERLSDEGRPRAAIAMLESALEVYPGYPVAWCRLSAMYLEVGDAQESLTAAKRAIVLGEPSWAHRLASLALVELGRHEEAVISAGEAVRRDPGDWRALVTLSEALAHSEPEQAVRAARAAVDMAPKEARAHEVLGDAAMLAHDWMLAEQAYTDALNLDPTNDEVATKRHRLVNRPADDARRHRRPVRTRTPPDFGRANRVAWYLAVRRPSVWLAVGAFVSLFAPLPWFGAGVLLSVGLLAWRGFAGLPAGSRVPVRVLACKVPLAVAGGVALGVAVLAYLLWTVLVGFGSVVTSLLVVAISAAVVAVANTWLGLWRMWTRTR